MKLQEVTTYKSQTILNEGWQTLTESQRIYLTRFEKELWPLLEELQKVLEYQLTADQIKDVFQGAEDYASASGKNRTIVGKGVDAVKLPGKVLSAIDDKINELGRMAQNSGPIKNIDAKFEELKKKISTDNPEVAKRIKVVSDWAKANPGKASLAVGILTTAAAFATGPAGGAAAGFFLRSANDLLKGEKLSTAVGSATKTAAYGALAGLTINYLSDKVVDAFGAAGDAGIENAKVVMQGENAKQAWDSIDPGVKDAFQEFGRVQPVGATIQLDTPTGFLEIKVPSGFVPEDVYMKVRELMNTPISSDNHIPNLVKAAEMVQKEIATNPLDQDTMAGVFDLMTKKPQFFSELTADQLTKLANMGDDLQTKVDFLKGLGTGVSSAIQGAIQAAGKKPKEVTVKGAVPKTDKEAPKEESLSMDQRFELFLAEKEGEEDTAGDKKEPGRLSRFAKNLTTKVTADKLMKKWKKMGEPTDVGSIVNILDASGLSQQDISAIGQETNIKLQSAGSQDQKEPDSNEPKQTGKKDQAASSDIQQRMEKFAADVKKHNLQKEVIAMLNAQGDVQQPTKQTGGEQPTKQTGGAGKAGTQQGGYDTTVTQKKQQPAKPKLSTSGASMNPAYN